MMVRCALRTAWTSPLLVVKLIARSLISSSGRSASYARFLDFNRGVHGVPFHRLRALGSRASRRASPSMMKLRTVMDSAMAG